MSINIQKNVSLAKYTTFRIGGPAKFFVEIASEKELLEALDFAKNNELKIFVLGGGSNVLVNDDGFSGLVIKFKPIDDNKYWAGNSLASLVGYCKRNSFSGMEWAAGIPGTIGGAVRGNAGAYGGSMADNIESVQALNLENGEIIDYLGKDCRFAYRNSIFKENPKLVILSIKMRLEKGEPEKIENKMQEIIAKRNANLPKEFSAGSFFKNPVVDNSELILQFEKETGAKCQEGKIPAGWFVGSVGLGGKKIGGVMVSEKHANFIINTGAGSAQDVVMLVGIIKQKVRHQFDIELKEEIMYVGF